MSGLERRLIKLLKLEVRSQQQRLVGRLTKRLDKLEVSLERRLSRRLDKLEERYKRFEAQVASFEAQVASFSLSSGDHDLDRVVTLRQAAELAGVSVRTLWRNRPDKFVRLSPGRIGMRKRDALLMKKEG